MKKSLCIIIILSILLMLSSCWDYVGLESILTVTGIGIDIDHTNPDKIIVSFVGPPQTKSNASGSGTSEENYYFIKSEGDSLRSAYLSAQDKTNYNMAINSLKLIVFSEEVARKGIDKYLDPLLRNAQISPNLIVTVTNKTAEELLNFKTERIKKIPIYIKSLIDSTDFIIKKEFYLLREVTYAINSNYKGFIVPYLSFDPVKEEIVYEQVCIFKEYKMIDVLTESESLAYFLLSGIVSRDEYCLDSKHTDDISKEGSSFHIFLEKRKISSTLINNQVTFNITLLLKCETTQKVPNSTMKSFSISNPDNNSVSLEKKYENEISSLLNQSISHLLEKLQGQYKVDTMGFGEDIRVKYSKFFNQIKWEDEFSKAKFNIDINVKIKNSGIIKFE